MHPHARRLSLLQRLAVAGAAVAVYGNALANGFALDDNDVIARNALVTRLTGAFAAFAHSYWPESTHAGQYRPLTIVSFAIDWTLSHGSTVWLHAMNIGWHVAVCLLLWQLLALTLSEVAATIGALVFAVHPVHVEAVSNLVGRSELMCAAFIIAAVLAHRRASWTSVPLYALALFSKESGVTLIGLAIVSDLVWPWRAHRIGEPGQSPGISATLASKRWHYAGYVAVTAAYLVMLASIFRGLPMVRLAAPWMHATSGERLLTAASVVPEYFRLLLFPASLHVDYLPAMIPLLQAISAKAVIGIALVIVGVVAVSVTWRSRPALAAAILWLAVTIAPVSNVLFPTGIMLAERTLYLPSVAIALVIGWIVDSLRPGSKWAGEGTATPFARLSPAGATLGLVLVLLGARTWTRTPVWQSNKTAILASLAGEPECYRAHERAADVLEKQGDTAAALREYSIARSLFPGDVYLYQASANLLGNQGVNGRAAAERLIDSARAVDPNPYSDVMRHAWLAYYERDYGATIGLARAAYSMSRDSVDAAMVLTQAASMINDVADARASPMVAP